VVIAFRKSFLEDPIEEMSTINKVTGNDFGFNSMAIWGAGA
jgi:hypothetical protein